MPISVAVGAGETATSLASRLARANGYGRLQNLCSDQGISQLELAKGSLAEVRRVADLAGADPEHLIFSTPRLVEPGWFCLGNERIKFTAFTRMGGQICPACIAEDRAVDLRHGAFQRGLWQVSSIKSCSRHHVALQRPSAKCTSKKAQDFPALISEWVPSDIQPVAQVRRLDDYLRGRINEGRGSDRLSATEFHVIGEFCEALGALLLFGPDINYRRMSTHDAVVAGNTGFLIFQQGEAAIVASLEGRLATSGSGRLDYGKLFRPVLSCLLEHRRDTAFDGLRNLLREFILDHFYVPPKTSILGAISPISRVVTVGVTAKEHDAPVSLLNRQLSLMGAIALKASGNNVSERAFLVSRDVMAEAVVEIGKLSSMGVTRAVLGAERYVMQRLVVTCSPGSPRLLVRAVQGLVLS